MKFELKGEYIALCDLLKTVGIAQSGGQGKVLVADGNVTVDGEIELRKTAKIRKGQLVECFGETIEMM
jgi:ribosome-associated protein